MKTENIKIAPKWSKSKEEIWNEISSDIEEQESSPTKKRKRSLPLFDSERSLSSHLFSKYAAAIAVIAIISFACFYEKTEHAARGQHLAVTLPDNSEVYLNADSELSYKPYLWFISRNVKMKGEAFFDVKKGNRFTVKSFQNEVRVLGTSFNVFARNTKYNVTCLSGKVEVKANNKSFTLTPNMQLQLRNKTHDITENINISQSIEWMQNKFSFISVPLADVVEEIERQYDIHITTTSNLDYLYTGNSSKDKKPNEILEIIGKPFGIIFRIEQ